MEKIRQFIFDFLDIFYPLFNRFFNKQTYYYAVCGGINTLFQIVAFFYCDHYLVDKHDIDLIIIVFKPHIASLFFSIIIAFPTSFLLTKYIVWHDSNISTKKQLFRHFTFVMLSATLNYCLLKLFVEIFGFWATPSQIIITTFIIVLSYLTQKYISFKKV